MSKIISQASGKELADPSIWRRLFQRQLTVSIVAFAGFLTLVGLLVLGFDLAVMHGDTKTVFLEVAVSLILFGTTTLFVTVAVADSLETRLEASIKEILESEKGEIAQLGTSIKEILEGEKDVVKLNQITQEAIRETQEDLRPLGGNWRALGLTNVYLTRSDGLDEFGWHIRDELRRANEVRRAKDADSSADTEPLPRLWIAASSMTGLLESASMQFDGLGIFTWAAELAAEGKLDLRILMTHPAMARLHAISEEILEAVYQLMRQKVSPECVRMAVATPTVFAIATRDQMLLNPYPYSQEAGRSFALTVRRSQTQRADHPSIERDIFEQYERRHFERAWETALALGEDYGIPELPIGATPPPPGLWSFPDRETLR